MGLSWPGPCLDSLIRTSPSRWMVHSLGVTADNHQTWMAHVLYSLHTQEAGGGSFFDTEWIPRFEWSHLVSGGLLYLPCSCLFLPYPPPTVCHEHFQAYKKLDLYSKCPLSHHQILQLLAHPAIHPSIYPSITPSSFLTHFKESCVHFTLQQVKHFLKILLKYSWFTMLW